MILLNRVIQQQRRWSAAIERLLPVALRCDGYMEFGARVVPAYLYENALVFDFGGGKQPTVDRATKANFKLNLVGIDIDPKELARAPEGTYDSIITADIATYRGDGQADIVICRALLEHISDVSGAFLAISTALRPGGRALIFVPSRNAVFARFNLILPERLKRVVLFALFPEAERGQGFAAFYDRCTPKQMEKLAIASGLRVEARHLYWYSGYFTFLVPLHLIWRAWSFIFKALAPVQSAETFTMVLVKSSE